jgi:hypothetical protein
MHVNTAGGNGFNCTSQYIMPSPLVHYSSKYSKTLLSQPLVAVFFLQQLKRETYFNAFVNLPHTKLGSVHSLLGDIT